MGQLIGSIAISIHQRPSIILREEELIPDEPGMWNILLDSRILANVQPRQGEGSLTDEIERKYQQYGIRSI